MSRVRCVLAPNPGPFTLEGTNTWIVGSGPSLVIDPGPDDMEHLGAAGDEARPVAAILLTHHHPDHDAGAWALSTATGAPILSFRPRAGERRLEAGDAVAAGGVRVIAVHTQGHTADHLVFHEPAMHALFTGDAVLGRGTSVIDPPEGDMAQYMRSLEAMLALRPEVLYPGHGPAVPDAPAKLQEYLDHRRMRERQVLEGLRDRPRTPDELVPDIYEGYPRELYPAAARSVLAHLLKLEREGRVARAGPVDVFTLPGPRPADGDG